VPLIALALTAVTRTLGRAPTPSNWTAAHLATVLTGPDLDALTTSLLLASTAALGAVLLGALVVALRRRRGGPLLGTAATATFAVPGTSLAVAMLLAYGPWLRDTVLLVLLAYLAKFWALGHRPLAGAVDAIPPEQVRAARAAGASPLVALRTVTLPQLRPAIAGGALLVFSFAFHELTMSVLLVGPGVDTLAVRVLDLQQLGDPRVTAALAVVITLVALAAVGPVLLRARGPLETLGWTRRG
jgi:iron(III) transport system permease protein